MARDEMTFRDIVEIMWRRKWILISIPVICILLAWTVTQLMTPQYTSTSQVALGNLSNSLYTNPYAVQNVIESRDTLEPIMEDMDLEFENVGQFRNAVQTTEIEDTNIVEVSVQYPDREMAQQITEALVQSFTDEEEAISREKIGILESRMDLLENQHEQLNESLERNQSALTDVETNEELGTEEKDITRARLLDYVSADQQALRSVESQIHQVQEELIEAEELIVVEEAYEPIHPTSPRQLLNLALGAVVGGMLAIVAVLLVEYFSTYPLRLSTKRKDEENATNEENTTNNENATNETKSVE